MNLLLTDRLTCPRCDAGAGLILLAERVEGRRVLAGQLGCPNCRQRYAVADGVADFTASTNGEPEAAPRTQAGATVGVGIEPAAADPTALAALLGVTEGPAMLLMLGRYGVLARQIADLIPDVEVVVAGRVLGAAHDEAGVSQLRIADRIPLFDRSMRGVVVGSDAPHLLGEAARVCALAARIVLLGATAEAHGTLDALGLHVLMRTADLVVAVRHG